MKLLKIYFAVIIFSFLIIKCSSSTEPTNTNSPSDHTVNKNGVMHKSGLTDPLTNCVECHGSDLKGGTAGVSCFSCHGKKWG
ncbi:MAG: hypothetical protein KDC90_10185 [Ignavibacteriae bacterium]|nr:hypothetical protein [Ignavibacteriota bacterium]